MFVRTCPECCKQITYSGDKPYNRALRNNSKCKSCSQKRKVKKSCSGCGINQTYNSRNELMRAIRNNTKCRRCAWNDKKGVPRSEETRIKMGLGRSGKPAWNSGKKDIISDDTRRKMRESALKRLERQYGQVKPNYNPEACEIIENYGREHGFNFQHAENGGEFHIKELGYWVDGYDKEKNVVVEYYEKHHDRRKDRDRQRQKEITNHLGCEFIILHP